MEFIDKQSGPSYDRSLAIERVIAEMRTELDAGREIDSDAIFAANSALQPELNEEWQKAFQVRQARLAANAQMKKQSSMPGEADNNTIADSADWYPSKLNIQIPGYEIIRELARGGQAVILLATQISTARKVAIKIMHEGPLADERALARFKREVEILSALDHPNIVTIIDTGQASDGSRFISMKYIVGCSLDEYLKLEQIIEPADPAKLLRLFMTICDAVNAAHARGIIHRDLKPSNILVDEQGEPHILDFGLARSAIDRFMRGEAGPVTISGEFLGSLPWSSPEQAEGVPDKIDIRTDVYSLGVILYQMLTGGNFPYEVVGNIRDVLNNILTVQPTPPSKMIEAKRAQKARKKRRRRSPTSPPIVNEAIERVVMKALAKEREARYQTAGQLGKDVANYLAGKPTTARKRDLAMFRSRWGFVRWKLTRPGFVLGAGIALVILSVGIAGWNTWTSVWPASTSSPIVPYAQSNPAGLDVLTIPDFTPSVAAPRSVPTMPATRTSVANLHFDVSYSKGAYVRKMSGTVEDPWGLFDALAPMQPPPGAHGAYGLPADDKLTGHDPGYALRQLGRVARKFLKFDSFYDEQPALWGEIGVQNGILRNPSDITDTTLGWAFFDVRLQLESQLMRHLGLIQ